MFFDRTALLQSLDIVGKRTSQNTAVRSNNFPPAAELTYLCCFSPIARFCHPSYTHGVCEESRRATYSPTLIPSHNILALVFVSSRTNQNQIGVESSHRALAASSRSTINYPHGAACHSCQPGEPRSRLLSLVGSAHRQQATYTFCLYCAIAVACQSPTRLPGWVRVRLPPQDRFLSSRLGSFRVVADTRAQFSIFDFSRKIRRIFMKIGLHCRWGPFVTDCCQQEESPSPRARPSPPFPLLPSRLHYLPVSTTHTHGQALNDPRQTR